MVSLAANERVVVTGLGVLSPYGIGKALFFEGIRGGNSGIRRVSLFEDPQIASQVAGEVAGFNPVDYIEAQDLKRVPRVAPMAIGAAREALKDSGIDPSKLSLEEKRRMAVVIGTGGGGIDFAEKQYEAFYGSGTRHVTPYCVSSSFVGMLSSEVSIALGFNGPSHVLSTGCTSSTDAIGYAYRLIRSGVEEAVLTGGADACITRGLLAGFSRMKVVSTRFNETPEKASRPFDADRDGFVLSEGAWMFMLESESRARKRGAKIYGIVAGYGSTCEAYHRVAVRQDGVEPARAMKLALEEAGADVSDVRCVNLHGTGTAMNDAMETRALKLLFDGRAAKLATSALKSMIGHPQGACGAAGVAAALFTLNESFMPPTINQDCPDPECDLDYTPNRGRALETDSVLCNTIAFGSKNSALYLKKYGR